MFDSVTASSIPAGAPVIAGYVDGRFAWSALDWFRFGPAVRRLSIATQPGHAEGRCIDVEAGDITPQQAPAEIQRRRDAGNAWPWVYCSLSVWPLVAREFAAAGVRPPLWWIASRPAQPPAAPFVGAVGHQWRNAGAYDCSLLLDTIPGLDTPSAPPPVPAPPLTGTESPMTISQKRVAVRLAYLAALGREPESQQCEDTWAAQIADDGNNVDVVISAITDSTEAQTYRAAVRKAAGLS